MLDSVLVSETHLSILSETLKGKTPEETNTYGPAYGNLVLIALVASKSSDEPVQMQSLTGAFAAHTQKVGQKFEGTMWII